MRRRELLATAKDTTGEFVDLGLSVIWATGNIVNYGTKYSIGSPTDRGCYFSWGNVVGHNKGEEYEFSEEAYNSGLAADISPTGGNDAARVRLGGNWRMPTKDEFKELYDNTDSEWVSDYNGSGMNGRKFMKKSDHSKYIFLPACGQYDGTYLGYDGSNGYYWSSTYESSSYAYGPYFNSNGVYLESYDYRYCGYSVRGVMSYVMNTNVLYYNAASSQYKVFNFSDFPSNDLGWTPIAIEVVPPSHDRYGDGSGGYMSLGGINTSGTIQTNGANDGSTMYWGPYDSGDDTSLTNYTRIDGNISSGYVHSQTNSESTSCSFSNTANNVQYPYTTLNGTDVKSYKVGSLSDYDGVGNTNILNDSTYPAAYACSQVSTLGTSKGNWYLPSCGELAYLPSIRFEVNKTISSIRSIYGNVGSMLATSQYYWSSTESSSGNAWSVGLSGGAVDHGLNKRLSFRVRAFIRFNPSTSTIVR